MHIKDNEVTFTGNTIHGYHIGQRCYIPMLDDYNSTKDKFTILEVSGIKDGKVFSLKTIESIGMLPRTELEYNSLQKSEEIVFFDISQVVPLWLL